MSHLSHTSIKMQVKMMIAIYKDVYSNKLKKDYKTQQK